MATITVISMGQKRMITEPAITLAQWMSPGFPVGAFAYSHGLETAIDSGQLSTVDALEIWVRDIIEAGGGRSDVILLATAYTAHPQALAGLDSKAHAFAASAERLTETADQGAAFVRTINAIWTTDMVAAAYPIAVGRAAVLCGLPLELTAQMYLHAFAANLISAAVRLVPLGQTQGQKLLADLAPLITTTAGSALTKTTDDLISNCFAMDIAAMQHETQYSKVFRT